MQTLGNVTCDFCKTDDLSVVVADRIDYDTGPEAAAVLANTPALFLEAPLLARGGQRPLRCARCTILLV